MGAGVMDWPSVAENCQVDLAKARGIGEDVDLDDLAVRNRESHDREQLSRWGGDGAGSAVHQDRPCELRHLGEGERLPSDRARSSNHPRYGTRAHIGTHARTDRRRSS
jgi:hypothetical protein